MNNGLTTGYEVAELMMRTVEKKGKMERLKVMMMIDKMGLAH